MTYHEKAMDLHKECHRHYNCAQAILTPFAEERGLNAETAFQLAQHFGGGMGRGSVCGAVTGGLMALGLYTDDRREAQAFQKKFLEKANSMDCREILAHVSDDAKGAHCLNLVGYSAQLVEEFVSEL